MGDGALLLTVRKGFGRGRSWVVDHERLVIGRSDTCDIVIPDATVSRRHCEIMQAAGRLIVRDLGSSNAVMINGVTMREGTLAAGDELTIGDAVFLVTATGARAAVDGHCDFDHPTPPLDGEDETVTVAEGEISLLRDPEEGVVLAATPGEYAFLFHFGRQMSECLTEDALLERALTMTRKQFNAKTVWLFRCGPEGLERAGISPPWDDRLPPEPEISALMASQQGALRATKVPGSDGTPHRATVMIAPVKVAGALWGLMAAWTMAPARLFETSDLHLFVAASGILAPYLRAIEETERLRQHNDRMLALAHAPTRIVGRSPAIHKLRESVRHAAVTELPVLILGETGSGKELVAEAIHQQSSRSEQPYVVVNCAAIPNELFESEFFGHVRGAFTGAAGERVGLAEAAHGGTLFLDEIGDLSPANQARLLRFIELGTFRRLGSVEERYVDVRAVAATNRDLWQPGFRSDLLYRLDGFTIQVPALRQRTEDIPLLAQHFLDLTPPSERGAVTGFDEEALAFFERQPWPGNVREFMKAVRRCVGIAAGPLVTLSDVLSGVPTANDSFLPTGDDLSLAEVERMYVERVLDRCGGNMTKAAKILGVSRTTLYNKRTAWEKDSGGGG